LAIGVVGAEFVKLPYLQNMTDTTAVVRWESSTPATGRVQYGLTPAYGQEVVESIPGIDHELVLTGLVGDTVYHYRAVAAADTSGDALFPTPVGPDRPFRVVVFGDNRSDSTAHQSVVNQILLVSPQPGLVINVGDLTYSGSISEYQTFFNIERRLIDHVTEFPSLGNHDVDSINNWTRFFSLPNNERWYTVHYGSAVFHCLDNYTSYLPGSEQYNWLLSELQHDSANPLVRHIFVFFHEPPYTTSLSHSSNLTIRQYLCPLLERFGVTLTFQGHVHCYEHSLVNGVHYIITGGGGAPLHTQWEPAQPWTVYREATYEFVLVDVRGDTVFCRGIKPDGTVIDSFGAISRRAAVAATPGLPVRPGAVTVSPNPCRGTVRIGFTLPESGSVSLRVYDVAGRQRAVVFSGWAPAGRTEMGWSSVALPEGSYYLILDRAGVGPTSSTRWLRLR